jgi:hypothetical protein
LAGAAFAIIRTGELRFRGLTAPDTDLPALAKMSAPAIPFQDQLVEWRDVLTRLAEDYRAGRAEVDPKETNTCDNCGLRALCRIREARNDR